MCKEIDKLREAAQRKVAVLEPKELEVSEAEELVEQFSGLEKVAAAGKAIAARRVADSGLWRDRGERSPAHWMARRTGEPVGQGGSRQGPPPSRSGCSRRSRCRRGRNATAF